MQLGVIKINISKYTVFSKVIEAGGLTRAAQMLGCTQSGVSHAINSLEEELGTTLLIRNRSGIKLTSDGEQMSSAIQKVADALEEMYKTAEAIHGLETGIIRVGAFTSVAVHWLPGIIKEFREIYPNIEFGLMNGDYHDITEWLLSESIDIGFVTLPFDIPSCECIPLIEDRLLAVLPSDHRLAGLNKFPLEALRDEPFISLLEQSNHDARKALEIAGVKPNIKFTTKDDYAIIAMVEQGLGVSIMPELLLMGNDSNVKVMPLENDVRRIIGLAIPVSCKNSPSIQRFSAHIRNWLSKKYTEI